MRTTPEHDVHDRAPKKSNKFNDLSRQKK